MSTRFFVAFIVCVFLALAIAALAVRAPKPSSLAQCEIRGGNACAIETQVAAVQATLRAVEKK